MAKFDAGQAVEALEYDFTMYGGGEGTIKEPSTVAVNRFFKNMKAMVKEVNALSKNVEAVQLEDMDDADLEKAMSKMDEAEEGASVFQQRTVEYIAELCGAERVQVKTDESEEPIREDVVGGSPSVADLNTLPYRVLQAFSTWLVGEIRPKKDQPAGPR